MLSDENEFYRYMSLATRGIFLVNEAEDLLVFEIHREEGIVELEKKEYDED